MSALDLFLLLKSNISDREYSIIPVTEKQGIYIGIDWAHRPYLFVETDSRSIIPAVATKYVSLHPTKEYRFYYHDGRTLNGFFRALRCETSDRNDVDTFLGLIDALLINRSESTVLPEALDTFFHSLIKLFSIIPESDIRSARQGLWGELFFMSRVRGFNFWAPYWHSEITRKFDFTYLNKRLEVKTTISGQRIHSFSHRQLYALQGEEIVISSMILREEEAGLSLKELIEECRHQLLGSPYYIKLERAIRRASMGNANEVGPIFDQNEAHQKLSCFWAHDVPHFRIPEPPGVSETRYRVDLSTADKIEEENLDGWLNTWS